MIFFSTKPDAFRRAVPFFPGIPAPEPSHPKAASFSWVIQGSGFLAVAAEREMGWQGDIASFFSFSVGAGAQPLPSIRRFFFFRASSAVRSWILALISCSLESRETAPLRDGLPMSERGSPPPDQ